MISHYLLSRMLQKEWYQLETEVGGNTDFIKGIVRGLKLANAMALDLWKVSKNQELSNNPRGNKSTYYQAIVKAHEQIKSYRRHHAIRTLGTIIERVEREAQKKTAPQEDS